MRNKRTFLFVFVVWALIMSCNMPFGAPPSAPAESAPSVGEPSLAPQLPPSETAVSEQPLPTFTPIVVVITSTPLPTETPCLPSVFAPTPVNIRSGPGKVYDAIGALNTGQTAKVTGKNADGTWWYIEFPTSPGYYGWVGGSVVEATCIPASLAVIAAPPTPTSTPTEVPVVFAVTSVTYSVTTWSDAGHTDCPRIKATIKVNGAGTVTYSWTRSDGATSQPGVLVFNKAGAKSITSDWALGSVWAPPPAEWMGIYIDSPNHQDFGHANMPACTAP